LEDSDPLLPPNADAARTLEIVPVHNHVNSEVQGDGNPGHCCQTNQLGIAKECGGTVMIGVEKGEWLLLQNQEDGIEQLEVLRQVVELNMNE
jgi:hypothetical protein